MTKIFASIVSAALVSAMLITQAFARELYEYDWIEVETEHFVMRSILGERATLKHARELNRFIEVIPGEIRHLPRDGADNVTLYLLRDSIQVDELMFGDRPRLGTNPWMYREPGTRTVVIGLATDVRRSLDYVYARYLFGAWGNTTPEDRELLHWWQEGLVRYYSYTDARRGYFYFGRSSRGFTDNPEQYHEILDVILNPASRPDLPNDDQWVYVFYSHRLMRFLIENKESWADLGDRLKRYIRLTSNGTAYQSAFEEAFSMTMDELAAALSEHSRTCCTRYKIPLEVVDNNFIPQVRELDRETIRQALNEMTERAKAPYPDE